MTEKKPRPPKPPPALDPTRPDLPPDRDGAIARIAEFYLGIYRLTPTKNPDLDYYDLPVGDIRDALYAAYDAALAKEPADA